MYEEVTQWINDMRAQGREVSAATAWLIQHLAKEVDALKAAVEAAKSQAMANAGK